MSSQPAFNYERIITEELHFDRKNPRLVEFSIQANTPENELLKILWREMGVNELVLSIKASGFFSQEPLWVVKEDFNGHSQFVVIEGNRRLAAVKAILSPEKLKGVAATSILMDFPVERKKELLSLPVVILNNREDAWRYIGFKHINGPAKWGSYAKAQYISQIHIQYEIPLADIASQIGDTFNTVLKLYQGYRVIEQAEAKHVFDRTDITSPRLFFSHLYTGLNYEGFQEYIGIQGVSFDELYPVPKEKLIQLGEVLTWLFGSKRQNKLSVISSQNPDLRYLDAILKNRQATLSLKDGKSLMVAYELSQPKNELFEKSIVAARIELRKAFGLYPETYKGDLEMLQLSGDVADLADKLYASLNEIYEIEQNKLKEQIPKKRITTN